MERMEATLLFDSLTSKRGKGLRGYTFTSRQLLFSAGPYDVNIELTPIAKQISLDGQLLINDETIQGHAQLVLEGSEPVHSILTRHGEFHFVVVQPGAYTVLIQVSEAAIHIPPFNISL